MVHDTSIYQQQEYSKKNPNSNPDSTFGWITGYVNITYTFGSFLQAPLKLALLLTESAIETDQNCDKRPENVPVELHLQAIPSCHLFLEALSCRFPLQEKGIETPISERFGQSKHKKFHPFPSWKFHPFPSHHIHHDIWIFASWKPSTFWSFCPPHRRPLGWGGPLGGALHVLRNGGGGFPDCGYRWLKDAEKMSVKWGCSMLFHTCYEWNSHHWLLENRHVVHSWRCLYQMVPGNCLLKNVQARSALKTGCEPSLANVVLLKPSSPSRRPSRRAIHE